MSTLTKAQIFTNGGVLGLESLNQILQACRKNQVKDIQFGQRQEIILKVPENRVKYFQRDLRNFEIQLETDSTKKHNIITSYLAQDITTTTYWMKEGIYYDILDQFSQVPKVRVNITDLKQDFVYSFTGDINFVASEEINFWNVYFRTQEHGNLELFPYQLHTEDIAKFTNFFEILFYSDLVDYEEIVQKLIEAFSNKSIKLEVTPRIRVSEYHNYEGFHEYKGKSWLGIYMRDTRYSINKLEALRQLASIQRINALYITPWKSIIIKDILEESVMDWKMFLAQNSINIGHSHSELNWQLNDFDQEALDLKAHLRKEFSRADLSLIGVIFGINNLPSYSFSHIVIRQKTKEEIDETTAPVSYDILYRKDFNPTINEFLVHKERVPFDALVETLNEAIQLYYKIAYEEFATFTPKQVAEAPEAEEKELEPLYQCKHCMTIYDAEVGDEAQGVAAGTNFNDLKNDYLCPVCESDKSAFAAIQPEELTLL